ncbi:hypothetical protein AGLY_012278 [Aphis glycines]|uniref:Uncharacterized protein n=1 Tax=Aphis glycines TaxID=307491 RepID=A0A6G0T9M7_APHGL|nr:hypothetical protein AGLY_012278 [Aphis glycines]
MHLMRSPGTIMMAVKIPENAPAQNSRDGVKFSFLSPVDENTFLPNPNPKKLIANIGATPDNRVKVTSYSKSKGLHVYLRLLLRNNYKISENNSQYSFWRVGGEEYTNIPSQFIMYNREMTDKNYGNSLSDSIIVTRQPDSHDWCTWPIFGDGCFLYNYLSLMQFRGFSVNETQCPMDDPLILCIHRRNHQLENT